MKRLILAILFCVVFLTVPITYFMFISEPVGVPMGGYDSLYLAHIAKYKIYGQAGIGLELLALFVVYRKLRK